MTNPILVREGALRDAAWRATVKLVAAAFDFRKCPRWRIFRRERLRHQMERARIEQHYHVESWCDHRAVWGLD